MIDSKVLETFINSHAKKIDGWFFPGDVVSIAAIDHAQGLLSVEGGIVEIGVWHGKSLVFLSHLIAQDTNQKLVGIDIFPDDTLQKTRENMSLYGSAAKTSIVKADTTGMMPLEVRKMLGQQVRLLHIDAGHEYHEVMQQCVICPLCKPWRRHYIR